jgi:uncharacterized lipoprotein
METDWAENRAKIPQDFIRQSLGKFLDSLYSTSERDKFRTRLERTPSGETEIYISHRGMIEVYPSGNAATPTTRRHHHGLATASDRPGTGNRIPAPPDGASWA